MAGKFMKFLLYQPEELWIRSCILRWLLIVYSCCNDYKMRLTGAEQQVKA
jgi:hypothetical protein